MKKKSAANAVPLLVAFALVAGCGSSPSRAAADDASIKQELLRGVHQIRAEHDRKKLSAELARVLVRLGRARGSTVGARARVLAMQGFEATIKGIGQLDFSENDSGEVAAATRDAERADRYLTLGANRLRAAGQALGIQIGKLNQH